MDEVRTVYRGEELKAYVTVTVVVASTMSESAGLSGSASSESVTSPEVLPPTSNEGPSVSFLLPNEDATIKLGQQIASVLRPGLTVLLKGNLGAGKTCLARALMRHITQKTTLEVPSPSYLISFTYIVEDEYGLLEKGSKVVVGAVAGDRRRI